MIHVAIVTYNRQPMLQRLLNNGDFWVGLALTGAADVTVLDQGSTDHTGSYLLGKDCRWIRGHFNYGCGGGRQRVVDYLQGKGLRPDDVIAFLDDDIRVGGDNWALQLTEPIRASRAAVSGALGRQVTEDWLTRPGDPPDYVSGCAFAVRAQVFLDCSFDPQFFPNYWEDVDFCWQVRRLGYRIEAPKPVDLIHDTAADLASVAPLVAANREKFRLKWEGKRP
jgi:GT2 family glycosyltransferase